MGNVRWLLALLGGIALQQDMHAQTFSTRNDFHDAMGPEMGWTLMRQDSGYLVVQGCVDSMNIFYRIGFTRVSVSGLAQEVVSYGRDSLVCYVGWAGGQDSSALGGLALFGSTYNGVRGTSLLWRFDGDLDSLWSQEVYPDTADQSIGNMVRVESDGYHCLGSVWHGSLPARMFLATVDSFGNVNSVHEYGASLRDEGYSMDPTADGGYVLAGHSWFNSNDYDGYVVKVDANGDEEWHQYLGGPYRDDRVIAIATTTGGYVAVGAHAGYQSGMYTAYQLYAAGLNASGDVVWERGYGPLASVNGFSSVRELSDGNFLAAGLIPNESELRGVLLKFAPDGDSLWLRIYKHPPLDSIFSAHEFRHAAEDPDGSIVATGSCNDGQQDLWVLRVDSFGCLVPGCQLYDHVAEQPALPGEVDLSILAWPNPTSDRLFISFRSAEAPSGVFRLFDGTGKEARHFRPTGRSEEIDLDVRSHPSGLYVLQYADRRGVRWSDKIVIE